MDTEPWWRGWQRLKPRVRIFASGRLPPRSRLSGWEILIRNYEDYRRGGQSWAECCLSRRLSVCLATIQKASWRGGQRLRRLRLLQRTTRMGLRPCGMRQRAGM